MISALAAMVTFYNPDDSVIDNIDSYINHVDILYIIDNSIECNKSIKSKLTKKYKNIRYIHNSFNLGVAKALNVACEFAISDGFSWILTMDQDSKFFNFSEYLNCANEVLIQTKNIALFGANHLSHQNDQQKKCTFHEEQFIITSSNILNLNYFNEIGKFNTELFIDEVDHDYCARAYLKDFKIICFNNIFFSHSIGYKHKGVSQHNHIRLYYITRNSLYMMSKYGATFEEYKLKKILYKKIYKKIFKILKSENNKTKKILYMLLGIIDFFLNRFGKRF